MRLATGIRSRTVWGIVLSCCLVDCGRVPGTLLGDCSQKTSFITVDDFELAANKGAQPSLVRAAGDNLFVVGRALDDDGVSNNHAIVRQSDDRGATWFTAMDWEGAADQNTYAYAFASSESALHLGGMANGTWYVRRSADGAATWTDSDALTAGSRANAIGTSVDGLLFAAGWAGDDDGAPNSHWIVRMSINDGATWLGIDDFELQSNQHAEATDIWISGSSIYVVGSAVATTALNDRRWIVRRSMDRGSSWRLVDEYQMASGKSSRAMAITSVDDAIYVVGTATDSTGVADNHWIVRKSSDRGDSWETVDDFELAPGQEAIATAVAGLESDLYVSGPAKDDTNATRWIVRRSSDGGSTWAIVDDYAYAEGQDATPSSIGLFNRDLFVSGWAADADDTSNLHWICRALYCGYR